MIICQLDVFENKKITNYPYFEDKITFPYFKKDIPYSNEVYLSISDYEVLYLSALTYLKLKINGVLFSSYQKFSIIIIIIIIAGTEKRIKYGC